MLATLLDFTDSLVSAEPTHAQDWKWACIPLGNSGLVVSMSYSNTTEAQLLHHIAI